MTQPLPLTTPAPASAHPPSPFPRRTVVRRAVAAWRSRNPELRGVITEAGLRAVLERESITLRLHEGPSGLLGRALSFQGHRGIILHPGLDGLAWLAVALHEIGHLALHSDRAIDLALRAENPEPCVQRGGKWFVKPPHGPTYARIEAEADLFADLLLAGQRGAARAAVEAFDPYAGLVPATAAA